MKLRELLDVRLKAGDDIETVKKAIIELKQKLAAWKGVLSEYGDKYKVQITEIERLEDELNKTKRSLNHTLDLIPAVNHCDSVADTIIKKFVSLKDQFDAKYEEEKRKLVKEMSDAICKLTHILENVG